MSRVMIVKKERCNPQGCGGFLCMRVSPSNRAGKECIVQSDDGKVEVNEEVLTDADFIAAKKCPFDALLLVNLPAELKKEPIHRYGKNKFALYNLPVPSFGKVVGIIGRNGIGKSTAIQILAGQIEPNLGDFEKGAASHEDLIDYFKGTEAQAFLEKVKKGEIKVAYKPQRVELIPKQFKGTCKELLEKVNEKGDDELKRIIEVLDLDKILDNDIAKISGGELQRIAIAATVLKQANVYLFDEPTSYLDIKQRLKLSKFIRTLATPDTAVLVIEHDLIILDYMTDLVYLMYGKETAYGIVSQTKTTKAGINVYLSGYLKEENIRFRDQKIKFESRPPRTSTKEEERVSWKEFKETVGKFSLKATPGTLHRHEIMGVLGENGIGKTTFVKVLAGEIGEHSIEDLKISYKPQYLEAEDELVAVALKDAIKKHSNDIIRPLSLEPLLNLKVSELSGGELQRVKIAQALAKEADIVLLDEPSAYLDVEQRLQVSKVINDVMMNTGRASIVVDHDLLFLDYLSDRLIVFDGEPAVHGIAKGPFSMENGMNKFLADINMTFRRDEENHRPRANKEESLKDREQKASGKLYYS
ncbi:ribosome biogenesis/translation initiation ATPase RLI [Nanoarchaeota archaeon]